ncbi:hypothetical protein HNQ56_004828 [Anaerotaenia torta]|uniref:hypothetical protein n=1 Tax=Anaerotaenia torta TaxID=433293 RepID=UPI003D1C2BED
MNSTITLWKITTDKTLDEIASRLLSVPGREIVPEWNNDGPLIELQKNTQELGTVTDIHTLAFNKNSYRYISFNIYMERKKRKDNWYNTDGELKEHRDRVTVYQSNMIIYENGNELFLMAFAAKTTVNKIAKYAFEDKDVFNIIEQSLNVSEDMFYWILKALRDYPGEQLHRMVDITPTGLWGYFGKTLDGNNSIRAEGQRILAVLGTLAVIFSSEELKAVKPEFQKDGQVVVVEINLNNSLKIDDSYCLGSYFNIYSSQEQVQQRINVIGMYTINIIIPQMIIAYENSVQDKTWSKQLKIDFISSMGAEIKRRVELELESLKRDEDADEDCDEENNY